MYYSQQVKKVNVGLISPLVSVVYKKTEVKDIEVQYKTTYVDDKNRYTDYKQVTTQGQNGVKKNYSRYKVC